MSALLALDTSTEWASVAIYDGTAVLGEETWHAQRRHAEELFPTIERILSHTRAPMASITKIAVATGPGSFTGLRVAIAAAQGLARGCGATLVGVSTLDVLAYPHASSKLRTCPLLPAGRGEFYAALYQERNRKWARRSPFIVGPLLEALPRHGEWRILVSPDHRTPLRTRAHAYGAVPFAIAGTGIKPQGQACYDEVVAAAAPIAFEKGHELMAHFLSGGF